jgi:hypothetical protein
VSEELTLETLPEDKLETIEFKRFVNRAVAEIRRLRDEKKAIMATRDTDNEHPRLKGFGLLVVAAEMNTLTDVANALVTAGRKNKDD